MQAHCSTLFTSYATHLLCNIILKEGLLEFLPIALWILPIQVNPYGCI